MNRVKKNKHNKIPLPWAVNAEPNIREIQTKDYWTLSQNWHGRKSDMTVEGAIRIANIILSELDPSRRLAHNVNTVKNDIVVYGSKSNKIKQVKNPCEEIVPCKMILL